MKATLTSVNPEPRMWGEKWPDQCSVEVLFADGSKGEVKTTTKKDAATRHVEALTKLVGKEADFELEDKGQFHDQQQWGIKNYEGKTVGASQGERGAPQAAWRNTEAGQRAEQEAMDRRTALMQAVALHVGVGAFGTAKQTDLIGDADRMYAWLRESKTSTGEGTREAAPEARIQASSPVETPSARGSADSHPATPPRAEHSPASSPPPTSGIGGALPDGAGEQTSGTGEPVKTAAGNGASPSEEPLENRRMAAGKYKGYWYSLMAKKEPAHFLNADDEELGGDFYALALAWVIQENPEAADMLRNAANQVSAKASA